MGWRLPIHTQAFSQGVAEAHLPFGVVPVEWSTAMAESWRINRLALFRECGCRLAGSASSDSAKQGFVKSPTKRQFGRQACSRTRGNKANRFDPPRLGHSRATIRPEQLERQMRLRHALAESLSGGLEASSPIHGENNPCLPGIENGEKTSWRLVAHPDPPARAKSTIPTQTLFMGSRIVTEGKNRPANAKLRFPSQP